MHSIVEWERNDARTWVASLQAWDSSQNTCTSSEEDRVNKPKTMAVIAQV